MRLSRLLLIGVVSITSLSLPQFALGNGLGESRPFQFRTDSQRQVLLTLERTRLEMLGLLGSGIGGPGSGSGQTGNAVTISVSGSNNNITVTQRNLGNQTQSTDCSGASFNITGGMYGC